MTKLTTWQMAALLSSYALATEGNILFHNSSITVSKRAFVPKGSSWHEAQKIRLGLNTLHQHWVKWTFADPCGKGREETVYFSFLTRPQRPLALHSSLTWGASNTFTVDGFNWYSYSKCSSIWIVNNTHSTSMNSIDFCLRNSRSLDNFSWFISIKLSSSVLNMIMILIVNNLVSSIQVCITIVSSY